MAFTLKSNASNVVITDGNNPMDVPGAGGADAIAAGGLFGIATQCYNYLFNGSTFDRLRTPTVFKSVQASAAGDTAVWTPANGKKFRLQRLKVQVPANATIAARGVLTIKLRDATTDLNITHDVYLGQTAIAADTNPQQLPPLETAWIDLGNGILSALANNVLNVNLSVALATSNVRVTVCGTEE